MNRYRVELAKLRVIDRFAWMSSRLEVHRTRQEVGCEWLFHHL
jgi:hypothetical protein